MPTKKLVILLTVISFFFWACKTNKMVPSQKKMPRVENVHFAQQSDTVNVFYDLYAHKPDAKFDIKLLLSLGNNQTYQIDSTSTSGAIGTGVLPGKKKKIKWNALDDFPGGIQGKEIQFIVNARKTNSPKSKKWLYYTSGALLLGAGAVLGYLLINSGDKNVPLPIPPSRPAGN